MKRIVFFLMAMLMIALPSSAQNYKNSQYYNEKTGHLDYKFNNYLGEAYLGVRLGPAFTYVTSDDARLDGGKWQTGLNVGVVGGFALSESTPVFMETGLYYIEKGGKKDLGGGKKMTYDLNYLEIPVLVKYKYEVDDEFTVEPFAGGYFAMGVGGKIKNFAEREAQSSFRSNNFRPGTCQHLPRRFRQGKKQSPDLQLWRKLLIFQNGKEISRYQNISLEMRIGIIVAMDKEFAQLKTLLTESQTERKNQKDFVIGKIGANEVVMQQCGIGKVNSAIGAVEMIDNYHPDLVISSGVAGGADINLNVTEVVVATNCVYHDAYCGDECEYGQILGMPATFKTPQEYVEKALAINNLPGNKHPKIHAGQIVSGEWFVDSKEKMRSILEHFPHAMAVDMESCSIAQTCHIYKTPFISFRIISDVPLKDTKAQMYFDFWAKMAEGSFNVTKAFLESL